MWLQVINKVKVTHQGEGHIKVKVKYLHPFKFYVAHTLCKQVVCIRLKCYLFPKVNRIAYKTEPRNIQPLSAADPGFPSWRQPTNLLFGQKIEENCMKIKKIVPRGWARVQNFIMYIRQQMTIYPFSMHFHISFAQCEWSLRLHKQNTMPKVNIDLTTIRPTLYRKNCIYKFNFKW